MRPRRLGWWAAVSIINAGNAALAAGLLIRDLATTGAQPDSWQPSGSESEHPADLEPQPSSEPLSVYPPEGRAQDQSSDAPPSRRPPGKGGRQA